MGVLEVPAYNLMRLYNIFLYLQEIKIGILEKMCAIIELHRGQVDAAWLDLGVVI